MFKLIVRAQQVVRSMADFTKACRRYQHHRFRSEHSTADAVLSHPRSPRERRPSRPGEPRAGWAALFGHVTEQPKARRAFDRCELASATPSRGRHIDASTPWPQQERRNRQEVLDQRMRLGDTLEMLPFAMLAVDRKNQIVFANTRAIDLFCYPRERLIGASMGMLFPACAVIGRDAVADGHGGESGSVDDAATQVLVARRQDGEGFHVEASTTQYCAFGQTLQIVALGGGDACREVDRTRNEMAHVVRVSSMGVLASSLAHELNQPLTAILSNAQAAQKFIESDQANIPELREALGDIILDNFRASEVINKIRTMVRKGDMELQPVDVGGMVRDMALLVHSDAVAREVRAQFDVTDKPVTVFGDRVQLQQVLLNLLLNAFDAVKECDPKERIIETTVREESGGGVRITVRDRGQGLAVDRIDSIFAPFFSTKPQGLGLGLSISRSIMRAHGGQLWAENNECKGASFHMTLPSGANLRTRPFPAS